MKEGIVIDRQAKYIGVYIPDENKTYTGIPRKKLLNKTKIYAGDFVIGNIVDNENFTIEQIKDRKNLLKRPSVANVDNALVVQTIKNPPFDSFLLDNLLAVYDFLEVEPIIVFNKIDILTSNELDKLEKLINLYSNAGYEVYKVSTKTEEGIKSLTKFLNNTISIVAGQSGAGKSSLVSRLVGEDIQTNEVSKKTQRGRHTTTGVKLYKFGENSYIADTPGFSKIDALIFMEKQEVPKHFREFTKYQCKFSNCTHTKEPDCKVREAVDNGEIAKIRYENYLKIINL